MMNSVSSLSTSILRANASSTTSATGASFSQSLAAATPTSGVAVSVSDAAKSLASSSSTDAFDFDPTYSNITHTQEEVKAYFAEGARRVSEMQGLPEGQYDFSKISAKQAAIVIGDFGLNHGAKWEDTMALSSFISDNVSWRGNTPVYSDVPKNAFSHVMTQQVSINGGAYGAPTQTLELMTSRQGSSLYVELDKAIYKAFSISPNTDQKNSTI